MQGRSDEDNDHETRRSGTGSHFTSRTTTLGAYATPRAQLYDKCPARLIGGSKLPGKQSAETCVMRGYEKLSAVLCSPEEIYQPEHVYIVKTLQRIIQDGNWQRWFWDADIEGKKHGHCERIYLRT
jgi:hypothetical protein